MNQWVSFFIGTPKRFLWSMALAFVVFAAIFPGLAQRAVFNVLDAFFGALAPLEGPLITLGIVAFGFYVILKPFREKKRNKH